MKTTLATPIILWSVDTEDWDSQNVKAIVKAIKAGARDGAIILLHDTYETTVEAVSEVLPWLAKRYDLLTVHELAKRKGVTLTGGEVYSSF